jgi:hypothetical protein
MMGRSIVNVLATLGVLASPGLAVAQDAASPGQDNAAIEVQGDRPLSRDEIIRGQRQMFSGGLPYSTAARFHDPLCVAVVGLEGDQGAVVAQRIRQNIRDAGLALAAESCKPNALVVANRDPKALIGALRVRDPQLFNRDSEQAIRSQLDAGRPAISWGETVARANDGFSINGAMSFAPNLAIPFPVFYGANPSRLRANLSTTKVNAIVFFDLGQLEDVHVNQLADYATLHLLGSPRDPAGDEAAGVPTILSLFAEGPAKTPLEMTSLDRAYLRGLYSMRRTDWAWLLTGSVLRSYVGPSALRNDASAPGDGPASPS